jgi:hypothetical protein
VGRRIQIGDLDAEEEDGNQRAIGSLRGWHVMSDNDNEDYDCKSYSRGAFSKEKDLGEDEDDWKAISNSGHTQRRESKHVIDSGDDIEDKSNFDERDTDRLLLNLHGTIVAQSLHDRDEGKPGGVNCLNRKSSIMASSVFSHTCAVWIIFDWEFDGIARPHKINLQHLPWFFLPNEEDLIGRSGAILW